MKPLAWALVAIGLLAYDAIRSGDEKYSKSEDASICIFFCLTLIGIAFS